MAFATASDVEARLGRDLTAAESTIATTTIGTVQNLIAESIGEDSGWASALTPVPQTLKSICVEKAISMIVNPTNIASQSEALGAYSHSQTFPRSQDIGIFLSAGDRVRVKRAVYGIGPTSVRTPTELEDYLEDLAS